MRRIMCVRLPDWSIGRLGRLAARRRETAPNLLVRTVASRQLIVACDAMAKKCGIRPGMTLIQGRSLCAQVTHRQYDPVADRKALEALARWMMRFTPIVCPVEFGLHPGMPAAFAVWLDVGGCERLFGGLDALVARVRGDLSRLGIMARVAIAPTGGAAWALASDRSTQNAVAGRDDLPRLLENLPLEVLRLEAPVLDSLHHLGVTRTGQLLQLPRSQLPSRFGVSLSRRLDQALGVLPEPLTALVHHEPVRASLEFDGSFDSLEAVYAVFNELLGRILEQLAQRGCGVRQLRVYLLRVGGPPIVRTLDLSRPSRHRGNLFNLFRCGLETLQLEGTRLPDKPWRRSQAAPQEGICGMRLEVPVFERLHEHQALLDASEDRSLEDLSHLVERLRTRLGRASVAQAALVQSRVPERAYRLTAELDGGELFTDEDEPAQGVHRPLRLLERPHEIRVMVCPSDDRDGHPIGATIQGVVHRFIHAIGPERIAGEWWKSHDKTRDYFDVETEQGWRLWVFRVNETYRWYWHGSF